MGTIWYLLSLREGTNTPLWLGETGENSNTWFYETMRMVENYDIGWNIWTHKKLSTITAPLSAPPRNANYDKVTEHWKGNGPRPSVDEASQGLFQMAEDLAIEHNDLRPDVIAALFSPDFNTRQVPYTNLTIPGTIAAVYYDIGNNGISYSDTEYMRVSSDDSQNNGNNGWSFRNDEYDIENVNIIHQICSLVVDDKPVGNADVEVGGTGGVTKSWKNVFCGRDEVTAGAVFRVSVYIEVLILISCVPDNHVYLSLQYGQFVSMQGDMALFVEINKSSGMV